MLPAARAGRQPAPARPADGARARARRRPGQGLDGGGLVDEHRARHPRPTAAPPRPALKGIQKAAALLVAIGEQRAGEIFKYLGEAEVEALSLELAKAQKVPTDVCRDVITEAVESVLAEDYLAEGGVDYARSVLMRSLGEDRADEIIGRLAATIERRPFEFLRRTPAEQIVVFLRNESPQTVALVISNLHTTLGRPGALDASTPRSRPTWPCGSR